MTFPLLKSGAITQYPLERAVRFSTQAVQFLDGSQQKFRLYGAGLRRWVLNLNLLDEKEVGDLITFMDAQGSAVFGFTDPVSGETANKCVIAGQRFEAGMTGELEGELSVVIEEVG